MVGWFRRGFGIILVNSAVVFECATDFIIVNFMMNGGPYTGKIFVEGRENDPACSMSVNGQVAFSFRIPIDSTCGTEASVS